MSSSNGGWVLKGSPPISSLTVDVRRHLHAKRKILHNRKLPSYTSRKMPLTKTSKIPSRACQPTTSPTSHKDVGLLHGIVSYFYAIDDIYLSSKVAMEQQALYGLHAVTYICCVL